MPWGMDLWNAGAQVEQFWQVPGCWGQTMYLGRCSLPTYLETYWKLARRQCPGNLKPVAGQHRHFTFWPNVPPGSMASADGTLQAKKSPGIVRHVVLGLSWTDSLIAYYPLAWGSIREHAGISEDRNDVMGNALVPRFKFHCCSGKSQACLLWIPYTKHFPPEGSLVSAS